jgi:NAD(P)H-nitrite reductase large subunit
MALTKFAVTPGFEVGGFLFTPKQLAELGSIVGEDANIEMTNFGQLYVVMDDKRIEEVQEKLQRTGLEIQPAGFYSKNLIACNFCRGAEEAGLDIAKALDAAIAGHPTPSPLKIGYAGCALGTSEPLLKDIGVVKMRNTFDIYVGGEPKGLKAALGQQLISGIMERQLIPIITGLIRHYQENGKKKEKFSKFVKRVSMEKLRVVVRDSFENE